MRLFQTVRLVAVCVFCGLLFQIGHFTEHLVQFGVWIGGSHDVPYMSPIATTLAHFFGGLFFSSPEFCSSPGWEGRQMQVGMEILHLVGNSIFLLTLVGANQLFPNRLIRYAAYIEAFHLYEHIMLTSTTIWVGQSVGLSTLFGAAKTLGGQEFLVGFRVSWHFGMNLLPSVLFMVSLMQIWRTRKLVTSCRNVP